MRHPRTYFATMLALWFSCALAGCATMINGTTQDVPFDMPEGTRILRADGETLPLMFRKKRDSIQYLRLERNKDYELVFEYRSQRIKTLLQSTFDAWWLLPDYFTLYGLIIDGATGAWHSFDGFAVRFPEDTLHKPFIEVYDPKPHPTIGITLLGGTGFDFPSTNLSFIGSIGAGYNINSRLLVFAEYGNHKGVDIMPKKSIFSTAAYYDSWEVGARLKFDRKLYVTGGGGLVEMETDMLKSSWFYSDSLQTDVRIVSPPSEKTMGVAFIGVGITGDIGFLELRQTFGLSDFLLSNGEISRFSTTALRFGINLTF